jgi:hypothetical protein
MQRLLLLSSLLVIACAIDNNNAIAKRKLTYSVSGKEVKITSETDGGANKNKYDLNYKVNDPKLEITLHSYAKDTDSSSKFRFKWKIRGVVEYVEANSQEGYQEGSDTTGTVWTFKNADFDWVDLPETTVDGQTVKHFRGRDKDGFFTLTGHISGGAFTSSGQTITPVSHKFDLAIDQANGKFSYTLANSKLAIVGWVMSSSQFKVKEVDSSGNDVTAPSSNAKQILFGPDASPEAFFSWATTVNANTTSGVAAYNIIAAPLRDDLNETKENNDDSNKKTSHAFDVVRPRAIFWDPMVGLSSDGWRCRPSLFVLLAVLALLSRNFRL